MAIVAAVLDRLGETALRSPVEMLVAAAATLLLGIGIAASGPGELGVSSGASGGAPDLVLEVQGSQALSTDTAGGIALQAVVSSVGGDPAVASARRTFSASDRRRATIEIDLGAGSAAERERDAREIAAGLDPGPLRITPGGEATALREARSDLMDDLERLALVIAPILLLALIAALGWRLALATLGVIGIAVGWSTALLRLTGWVGIVEASQIGLVPAVVIGTGLSLEIAVLFAAAYERFERRERDESNAVAVATKTAGSAGLWSAAGGALALAALTAFGIPYLDSAAFAAGLAALLAAGASLLVLPAALALWGWSVPGFAEAGIWRRLAGLVAWRREFAVPIVVIAVALLALLGVPGTTAELTSFNAQGVSVGRFVDRLPFGAAFAAASLAFLLLVLARLPVLAGGASIAGLLAAAAGVGAAVLVFQDGRLTGLLDYSPSGTLQLGAVACGVASVAAMAGARAASIAELIRAKPRDPATVERAQELAGPAQTISTVVLVGLAFVLLAVSSVAAKQFGLILATGLLIDLIVVRALVVPALARI